MVSRSCANLLDMATEDLMDISMTARRLPRVMTVPGIISDVDNYGSNYKDSFANLPVSRARIIIVANQLPLVSQKDAHNGEWSFSFDEDSLFLQMKDGFKSDTEVYYVGSLKADIDACEQEKVAQQLLDKYHCVPTFLPRELHRKFYHGFCKQQLWPLFHYMLPLCPDHGDRFDRSLWQAYISANKIFADKVTEVIDPDTDYVWVHDYHLMVLPIMLRKNILRVKLGFFLHSPFPSSEIYSTLPVREEILKSLLNCDLIGFHTFDYARHFLSCCSRMLGLDYESKRGYIGLEYVGRTVSIKILPVGIHMGRLQSVLNLPCTASKVKEIQQQFKGKKMIIGVDDMDIFKGISLKLLAVEQLLKQNPELQGNLVLVQIVNPARSDGKDVQEAIEETYSTAERIKKTYSRPGYDPVILIDGHVCHYEKVAYYAVAECCIVNAVRDGMNLVPYEYVVCRQGTQQIDEVRRIDVDSNHTSSLVVSEFVGCSPSLSGAIRVNPWDIEAVADALKVAITGTDKEMHLRHEKHYRYVSSHDIAYWARSFEQDFARACRDHDSKRWWPTGLGFSFRAIALPLNFRKMSVEQIVSAYNRTNRRAIFLDYDGTVMPQNSISKVPSNELISVLNTLCSDPKNTVFIISGRGRSSLSEWFTPCEKLGLAAEHGFFIRWDKNSEWETCSIAPDFNWKVIVEPILKSYTEATDGSCIESKESAIVWHHEYANANFGSCQAKELLDHLENVLANEPVVVKRGQHIVEVNPQGVSKGLAAENLLSTLVESGKPPDFVLCIGDDRSDEDMFESISSKTSCLSLPAAPKIFACTVGQKPSKAKYYLDDTVDVIKLLEGLASISVPLPKPSKIRFSFESAL
ncbi:probable alpha,alpha-trehalose-phosphate synthase [UDP-forming] 9 [Aristolochia californica]|uniref:probable alpha,alpha-trehalose-phosphate synthase [UDP-forming] 9 n=1 Tax=Aristolochia californica TaxID=171875 RepID=UPI0035E0701B